MARQSKFRLSLKSIMGALLVWLVLEIVSEKLAGPAASLIGPLENVAKAMLKLMPSFVWLAWQALETCGCEHLRIAPRFLQMLVSFWPLLHAISGVT
jgi:hypothetical protein